MLIPVLSLSLPNSLDLLGSCFDFLDPPGYLDPDLLELYGPPWVLGSIWLCLDLLGSTGIFLDLPGGMGTCLDLLGSPGY